MNESGHLTSKDCADYWQRTLSSVALLAVSDHVQECAKCRVQLRQEKPAAGSEDPVPYEDLVAWMDREGDPLARRELAARISNSPIATRDLINLLQFSEEVNQQSASTNVLPSDPSWRRTLQRVWPLAAGLVLGCALMWLNATLRSRSAGGLTFIDSGQAVIVRPNGEIPALGPLPPALQKSVHDAMSLGNAGLPAFLAELRGPAENLAGGHTTPSALRAIEPVGTAVISNRPVLRWTAASGATGYRINLLPASGGPPRTSPVLPANATSWSPEEALLPNEIYDWEIEALRGEDLLAKAPAPPAPEARFRVLGANSQIELQQDREKWGMSHLVMGLADARAGLVAEARHEFEALARENPQSELPRKLLDSLTN